MKVTNSSVRGTIRPSYIIALPLCERREDLEPHYGVYLCTPKCRYCAFFRLLSYLDALFVMVVVVVSLGLSEGLRPVNLGVSFLLTPPLTHLGFRTGPMSFPRIRSVLSHCRFRVSICPISSVIQILNLLYGSFVY